MSNLLEKIKSNCVIDENDCWNWNKSINEGGYGQIRYNNNNWLVHRLCYSLYCKIEIKNLILHYCQNTKCCNPKHLYEGTYQQNSQDREDQRQKPIFINSSLLHHTRTLKTIKEKIDFYLSNVITDNNNCKVSNLLRPMQTKYFSITYNKKRYYLHRLITAEKFGKDYDDKSWESRHICNNRSCINPEHLIIGTKSENMIDSRVYSKNTLLTREKVFELKQDINNWNFAIRGKRTEFDKFWSTKLNVKPCTIQKIRLGNLWKDIL